MGFFGNVLSSVSHGVSSGFHSVQRVVGNAAHTIMKPINSTVHRATTAVNSVVKTVVSVPKTIVSGVSTVYSDVKAGASNIVAIPKQLIQSGERIAIGAEKAIGGIFGNPLLWVAGGLGVMMVINSKK